MIDIQWVNNSQTLLRINNRIINLSVVTQIILNEELSNTDPPHVTFYFGLPIGSSLHHRDNVPSIPELAPSSWWITYSGDKAEKIREFFAESKI